jgi:hypothetical protein
MAAADKLYLAYGGMTGFVRDAERCPIMHQTANLLLSAHLQVPGTPLLETDLMSRFGIIELNKDFLNFRLSKPYPQRRYERFPLPTMAFFTPKSLQTKEQAELLNTVDFSVFAWARQCLTIATACGMRRPVL